MMETLFYIASLIALVATLLFEFPGDRLPDGSAELPERGRIGYNPASSR